MPTVICKRHHWKDGWICEKCGLKRADYEQMRTKGGVMAFNIKESLNYMVDYISTYGGQRHFDLYDKTVWVDDIIYGLGVSVDSKKYRFSDGYERFRLYLSNYFLSKYGAPNDLEKLEELRDLVLWWQDCKTAYTWLAKLWMIDAWPISLKELYCLENIMSEAEKELMGWKA